MISLNNLSVQYSGNFLFDHISFNINEKDRIGLVGKNGAGKTTLLRVIAKLQSPESGDVATPKGLTIGYLPQEKIHTSEKNIYDEALTAFSEIYTLEKKIAQLNKQLAERTDYESQDYMDLVKKLNVYTEQYNISGGNTIEADTEKILLGLGYKREEFNNSMKKFSGGWQMRVEIAKILLKKPDLILLDEPTNHLDIESIQWLEEFLSKCHGAVIIVSHDRAFLDNITNRTIEISLGKIYDYKASYSEYVKLRDERIENQAAAYNNQQKQVQQIEHFIERFRYKASKARQVQSKIKMLEKMDTIKIDEVDETTIHFYFPLAPHSGKIVLEAINAGKTYGNKEVLKNNDFIIEKGAKVAFVGRNGEGKTTLVRMINEEIPFEGQVKKGHNVKIGYYAQNQAQQLDTSKTVFETIDDIAVGDVRKRVRNILGSFLFSGETIEKKVKVLSGGEKSRLALACLLLEPVNLLILDEPTNHLDMVSKDILKNALIRFDGTLIVVSHDRDFLQGLTDRVYEFKNKKIREYKGDIYNFLEQRKIESLDELNKKNSKKTSGNKSLSNNKNKNLWLKKKEHEKKLRKISNSIKQCELDIHNLEQELEKMNRILKNPQDNNKKINEMDIFTKYEGSKAQLEKEMNHWENLQLELEELQNQKPI